MSPFRTGFGYDIHRIVENRKLILGGVEIPHTHGLEGHSDADVLTHAITDSLLGAAALRDIGYFFPDTDPQWKNMASSIFLTKAKEELEHLGYKIGNIDATVITEAPKLLKHVGKMKASLANILEIDSSQIGIKATSNEAVGAIGRNEAMAAYAVCLIWKK